MLAGTLCLQEAMRGLGLFALLPCAAALSFNETAAQARGAGTQEFHVRASLPGLFA